MSPLRALLIAIELVAVTCAYPQTSVLNRDVPAIPSGHYSLPSLLMKAGLATRVPMGIELAGSEGRPEFYPGNEQDISLQDFLTATVKTDGPYAWKQSGDVINVFPKRAISDVFSTEVGDFRAADVLPIEIVQSLLKQPRVAQRLAQKHITGATWVTGTASPSRCSISIHNLAFREALNNLVVSCGRFGWTAFYEQKNDKTYLWFQLW
jgi:hypothetical protein